MTMYESMQEVVMSREAYARALDRAHSDGRQSVLSGQQGAVIPREPLAIVLAAVYDRFWSELTVKERHAFDAVNLAPQSGPVAEEADRG